MRTREGSSGRLPPERPSKHESDVADVHTASLHRHCHAASHVLGLSIEHTWDLLLRRASSIPSTSSSSAFSEVFASSLQTPQAAVVSIFVFGLSRATWLIAGRH